MVIEKLEFLTQKECWRVRGSVMKMRSQWIDRGMFWTLGAATYQDSALAYPALAERINASLMEEFYELYAVLAVVIGLRTKMSVGNLNMTALPGFHIFNDKAGTRPGHIHIDEPYERVRWPLEPRDPFSFTAPLALPKGGGGLDYWPNCTDEQMEAYLERGALPEAEYCPYEVGKLYLHDGKFPHRIANPCELSPGDWRITLQGHGVTLGDKIALYF
jgi:hypothetical protein